MSNLYKGESIINDDNYRRVFDTRIDGRRPMRGLIPRDFSSAPLGSYQDMPLWTPDCPVIPRSEWSDRCKEQVETKSRLSDLRMIGKNGRDRIESLDQNGQGYCWAYSSTMMVMLNRLKQGLPYRRLSGHAVGCKVKGYRDQGGWSAQSLDFIREYGVPDVDHWAEKSMSRTNDTDATWENARQHKVLSGFVELQAPVYDRDLSFDQVATCLLLGIPVAGDFNWWGHAICLLDLVEIERGSFGIRFINSWTDRYGANGMNVLQGSKAIPDNAVASRLVESWATAA